MKCARAFSLMEVVIALGVLAIGITAVLGLMAATTKLLAESADQAGAERALAAAMGELERLGLAGAVPKLTAPGHEPAETARFYLSRDGARAGWGADVSASERFYQVSAFRIESVSPAALDGTGQAIAVYLHAEWPLQAAERHTAAQIHAVRR
jgi:type II secretory pathway component PulJ